MTEFSNILLSQLENDAQPLHEAEAELCLAQLRNMNTIYTTIIEKKQAEMRYQKYVLEAARTSEEAERAHKELQAMQSKCVDLYAYWLKELLDMQVSYDKRAFTLHQMLFGNCQWFLAKYGSLKTKASPSCKISEEGYDEAIAAYDKIFAILSDDLPTCNAFYIFLLKKYSQLVLDARNEAVEISKKKPDHVENLESILCSSHNEQLLTPYDNYDELPSTAYNVSAIEYQKNLDDFSKDCANDIEENYAKMDSKLHQQGTITLPEDVLKEKPKTRRLLRCKQAVVNCFRHLSRIRQSLRFSSCNYVSRSIRNGIEEVNRILLQIQQIDLKDRSIKHS
uniref:F-BAR domain-containing protein n=1 Tax=Syphacia muris TaxID=451379 RepID=A0A158R4B1_9BILA